MATHRHATRIFFVVILSLFAATTARPQTLSNRLSENATSDHSVPAPSPQICLDPSSVTAPARPLWLLTGAAREDLSQSANARAQRNCASNELPLPAVRLAAYRTSDAGPSLLAIATPLRTDSPAPATTTASPRTDSPARVLSAPWLDLPPSSDAVSAELAALGKPGVRIERAREADLDILGSQNACSDWFATKVASPARAFQSVSFAIDQRGPEHTLETPLPNFVRLIRQPYVARATQDGGANTEITINANGAFYKVQGPVLKLHEEGGPAERAGMRILTVGSYEGDTLEAQLTTLLHEFGHIIDLLPTDADDLDGASARNTAEVLRHCRPEVEAYSKLARESPAKLSRSPSKP